MRLSRSAGLLLLAALIGCNDKKLRAVEEGGPMSIDGAAIRERYRRVDPRSRLGIVTAVKRDANLAAVGDIPIQDFGIGDVMTFIDTSERPLVSGTVVNATAIELHIRYENPARGRREPRVGDLAVRLP